MKRKLAGLTAWTVQRLGAIYMLMFVVFFAVYFLFRPIHTYPQWQAWVARPTISLALFVFFTALLSHMWVGLRDVVFDYVRPARLQPLLASALGLAMAGLGAWLVWILLQALA